jgi:hypothetical protein
MWRTKDVKEFSEFVFIAGLLKTTIWRAVEPLIRFDIQLMARIRDGD